VTARKDSDHTPRRIPKDISRSETCGTHRSNVGNANAGARSLNYAPRISDHSAWKRPGNGTGGARLVSLLEPILEEDAIEARFLPKWGRGRPRDSSPCHRGCAARVCPLPSVLVVRSFPFPTVATRAPKHSGVSGVPSVPRFPQFA